MQFLLKFLLIAICVFWLLRLVARLLFPWALRKASEKMMGDAQQQFQGSQQQYNYQGQNQRRKGRDSEGKVHIDYVPPKERTGKGANNAGEFVDFEEVDNN